MKTERLFDKSSKISAFEAVVVSCEQLESGECAAVLDKTAFFPNEGGQSCDTGVIGGARVLSVDEADGVTYRAISPEETSFRSKGASPPSQ